MRWKIITNDERAKEVLEEFVTLIKKEYKKELGKMRYALIRRILPKLDETCVLEEDGLILFIPLKVPEMKRLKSFLSKIGYMTGEPKWKQKTIEHLKGYLMFKGVSFKEVVYVGD